MTDLLYATHAPAFEVGGTLERALARDLLRLEVEETTQGLKRLDATFINVGPHPGAGAEADLYLDGSILDFGKELEVAIGPPENQRIIFTGRISALEAIYVEAEPPRVRVLAEDALMKLRMTRRSKTYEQVSD